MIYFLFGDDIKRSLDSLSLIIEKFQKKGSSHIPTTIDCEEISPESFRALVLSKSLFCDRQLFIIKHLIISEHLHDFFSHNLEDIKNSENIFVLWEREIAKKNSFFELIYKNSKHQEFKVNKKPDSSTKDGRIVFGLADSWANRDISRSCFLFEKILANGIGSDRVFWTLVWHIRNLLMIKNLSVDGKGLRDIEKATKLHPFVVKKGLNQARSLSLKSLTKSFTELCAIDEDIKKGRTDQESAVLQFLLKSC
ncbi:DNA polymerase III subunit delta [Patescibacteria group bacterium]